MRKFSLALLTPVMSLPVMVTRSTWPASTDAMNSLKLNGLAAVWYLEEKFHAKPPSTTRTIQNARLLSVEFTVHFLPTPGLRRLFWPIRQGWLGSTSRS